LAVAVLLLGHRLIPNKAGISTILESVLPWIGVAIPLLALIALVSRAWAGLAVLLVPTLVWSVMFGPTVLPKQTPGASPSR
jgi:vancomycin resistance protein VanJ